MRDNKYSEREVWVDNVKVVACLLVVLGHFWQSMVQADIVSNNRMYVWFNYSISSFHVSLFFICSGYLYQKYSKVNSFDSWRKNISKKLICLGIPYLSFSMLTWLLKKILANSVNIQAAGLIETLLIMPIPPYWYLYTLLLLFCVTPTFSKKISANIFVVFSLILRIYLGVNGTEVYAVSTIMTNEIWFVFGMYLCIINFRDILDKINSIQMGILLWCIFIILRIFIFKYNLNTGALRFCIGLIACLAIIMIVVPISKDKKTKKHSIDLREYTFPIFLMHTIFAAPIRIILLRFGIENIVVHTLVGVSVSLMGPIIVSGIMKKSKWMEFFLYPGKYIKTKM